MGEPMDVLLRNKGATACVLRGLAVAVRLVPGEGSVLATRLTHRSLKSREEGRVT